MHLTSTAIPKFRFTQDLIIPQFKTPRHFHASPLLGARPRNRTWLALHRGKTCLHYCRCCCCCGVPPGLLATAPLLLLLLRAAGKGVLPGALCSTRGRSPSPPAPAAPAECTDDGQ